MPQKDFSGRVGTSTSKKINSVIKNSADSQRVFPTASATKQAYNKQPVSTK